MATTPSGPSGSSDEHSSSSNTGAIAGGVVGGVVGLALIAGLVWFLMRRKRKQRGRLDNHQQPQMDSKYIPFVEADGDSNAKVEAEDYSNARNEADGNPMNEMPERDKPAQPLPGQIHELEGLYPR